MTKIYVYGLFGGIIYWLGGLDDLLKVLIFLLCIDYLSGILKAIYKKELSSVIGYKGIARKVYKLCIIAVSFAIEQVIDLEFPLRNIVAIFFIINEAISILENAGELNIKYPKKLKNILLQLREKVDFDEDSL